MSINCREDLLNRQAKVNEEIKSYTCRVLVCSGTGCIASGAQKIYEEMEILCRDIDGVTVEMQKDVPHIGVIKTGCQGLCELGPLMRVEPYNYQYVHVQPEDCKEIVERTILEGQPVERLFYRDHETVCPHPDDIPFLNQMLNNTILASDEMQIFMQIVIVLLELGVGLALMGGLFTFPASAMSIILQCMFLTTTGLYLNGMWMIFALSLIHI